MSLNESSEQSQDRNQYIQLHGNTLRTIIQYMFTGCIDMESNNAVNLVTTARFVQMENVKQFCFEF